MTQPIDDADRISRRTFPSASFTFTVPQVDWITAASERLGISKSELIRGLIDREMRDEVRALFAAANGAFDAMIDAHPDCIELHALCDALEPFEAAYGKVPA